MCPAAVKDGALTVHRGGAERRLRAERKEHARLLREIGKKRAACELGQNRARDVEQELARGLDALQRAWSETLREVRVLLQALLAANGPLDKRQCARLRRHCATVLPASAWARNETVPGADLGAQPKPSRPMRQRPASSEPTGDAGASAPKPTGDRTTLLRATFRRLVLGLHPDTAPSEEERERRTVLMKEATRAYEAEDLARLVELERQCLAGPAHLEEEQQITSELPSLVEQNRALRRQLRKLTAEWKVVRDRAQAPAGAPEQRECAEDHVRKLLAPLELELVWLRRFRDQARLLASGRIEVAELIATTD